MIWILIKVRNKTEVFRPLSKLGGSLEYLNNVSTTDCVGKILQSKSWGKFKVLEYKGWRHVLVEFIDTGYRKVAEMKEVKTGSIKDLEYPSVYEVGIVGSKYPVRVKGKVLKEYTLWKGMLERCYSIRTQERHPTYKGCSVSEKFKRYDYFLEWCQDQIGFKNNWCLDKDILIKGNKVYSEDTCVFIPNEVNCVLTKTNRLRGKYPIGVCWRKDVGKFIAQVNRNKCQQDFLGCFDNPTNAFLAYKQAKEDYLKELAEKWKDQIDPRAYEALINYQVEITD